MEQHGIRILQALLAIVVMTLGTGATTDEPPTMASVLASSDDTDWRTPDPDNTVYMELPGGRVIMELAPQFAPAHVNNIRKLVRQEYFDGLAVIRSQENYVVQWGDPKAGSATARTLGDAAANLDGEYFRSAKGLSFTSLDSTDAYADDVGFVDGFPAARDSGGGRAWLAHCNAMLGAGRDIAADSGNGAELYVVIGHAPRHLDRNVTLVGRVIAGMDLLSTLPRGKGEMGFYKTGDQLVPIESIRIAADVPENERSHLELLKTDTATFRDLIAARRTRLEGWFIDPGGRIDLCNVPLPVRERFL